MLECDKELGWLYSHPSVLWKIVLASNELGYLAADISKSNAEAAAWFLMSAYSKMQKVMNGSKKQTLNKKETRP